MKKCTACSLSSAKPATNAVEGWGNPEAKLVIVIDCPGEHLGEKLLIWILRKLSLTSNDVWIEYAFKCPVEKKKKAELVPCYSACWHAHPRKTLIENKALVLAGNWSSTFVGGKSLKTWNGRCDEAGIWYVYSFNYLLMNPSQCLRTWRVIYKAAKEVGLNPRYNHDEPNFKFPSKKI